MADIEKPLAVLHEEKSVDNQSEGRTPESLAIRQKVERRVLWKQDVTMLPLLAMCFFFSYVDRGQIGNARILGLQKDLGLQPDQYYNALLVFFIGYAVIEIPCCLGLVYVKPGHQFGLATIAFGVLATSIAATKSYGGLIAIRFLLGLGEAFVQVGFLYISLWYRHDEVAMRTAVFFLASPLAGAVSGLIAYGVAHDLKDAHGIADWRWLFIVEGVPTIAWGIFVFFTLPGRPDVVAKKGTWLFSDPAERELIRERTTSSQQATTIKFTPRELLTALKDVKTYLDCLICGAFALGVAAFTLFIPTFILEFGFSPLRTQLFTIIPYAAAIVSLLIICPLADRFQKRAVPILACYALSATGFILLLATTSKVARVAGTALVAAGSYPGIILAATWIMSTHGAYTKRSTVWGMSQITTQAYSILGTKIFDRPPRFFKGHGVLLGLQTLAALCIVGKWWIMKRANEGKDGALREFAARGEDVPGSEMEYNESHPKFRYLL